VTARLSLLLLIACVGAWIASFAARGEVIAPHTNRLELGLVEDTAQPSSRRHSDYSNYYLPEMALHEQAWSRGELALWNPHVQLGRPASHIAGVSPLYPPMALCLAVAPSPPVAHTLLVCVTLLLIALFGWLWLRELGLGAEACGVGAALLAFSPFTAYWAPLQLFASTICWTLGVLWLLQRTITQPSAWTWWGLSVCVWLLLLSGYPQQVVWHLVVVWVAIAPQVLRRPVPWRLVCAWLGCAAVGVLLAAPVLLDTATAAARADRAQLETSFFLDALQPLGSLKDLGQQLLQLLDPRLAEGPRFQGVAFGLCGMALWLWSFALPQGRRWAWFVLFLLLLTWFPALYRPLLSLDAFRLSRFTPAAVTVIPLAAAAAWAVHFMSLRSWPRPVVMGLAGLTVLLTVLTAHPLLLTQPLQALAQTSPLVETLRAELQPEERYALVSHRDVRLLPANQETALGLHSVHSYDSLSSREYQAWCARLSAAGAQTAGRWFRHFDQPELLEPQALARAGVALLLSNQPLPAEHYSLVRPLGEFSLWRAKRPIWRAGLIEEGTSNVPRTVNASVAHDAWSWAPLANEAAFFAARQYHPYWRARVSTTNGVLEVGPTLYDNVYLSFRVPAGSTGIELRFEPYARFGWLAPLLVGSAALALALHQCLRRKNSSVAGRP